MKTVVNKTLGPLRVPLPGGKVLHLGPKKTGQIAANAAEHPPLKKLVDDGKLEIQEQEGQHVSAEHGGSAGPHESTHGHQPAKAVMKRGDRGS